MTTSCPGGPGTPWHALAAPAPIKLSSLALCTTPGTVIEDSAGRDRPLNLPHQPHCFAKGSSGNHCTPGQTTNLAASTQTHAHTHTPSLPHSLTRPLSLSVCGHSGQATTLGSTGTQLYFQPRCVVGSPNTAMDSQQAPAPGSLSWRLSSHPITLLTFLAFRSCKLGSRARGRQDHQRLIIVLPPQQAC